MDRDKVFTVSEAEQIRQLSSYCDVQQVVTVLFWESILSENQAVNFWNVMREISILMHPPKCAIGSPIDTIKTSSEPVWDNRVQYTCVKMNNTYEFTR